MTNRRKIQRARRVQNITVLNKRRAKYLFGKMCKYERSTLMYDSITCTMSVTNSVVLNKYKALWSSYSAAINAYYNYRDRLKEAFGAE